MQNIFTKNKKMTLIVVSALVVAAILVTAAVGIANMVRAQHRFNYLTDDISRYINFSGSYEDITLDISIDAVTESDIDEYIAKKLVENKSKTPRYNGAGVKNMPISVGDVAHIYYRGYTVEDGKEIEVDNACNFSSSTPDELEIGSGSFIPGFELGLVGKNPKDHTKLERVKSGLVLDNMVIYITYSALYPDGSGAVDAFARIDLSGDVDGTFGEGFEEYIIKKEIGKEITDAKTFKTEDGDTIYYDITVNYATKNEENPITVSAYFPYDYSEESLRCKEVFFDVYVEYVVMYDTPELTDEFVSETLKMNDTNLEGCDGATLAEKYRSFVRNKLNEEYEKEYATVVEDSLWVKLAENTTVKEYPASAVSEVYDEYYSDLLIQYENYGTSYSSISAFAYTYYEITDGTDYKTYITNQAKAVVKEKLIFYYVARTENLLPTAEEKDAIVQRTLQEYVDYYLENDSSYDRDKFDSDEKYNEAVEKLRSDLLKYYGQTYFDEIAYYEVVSEKMIDSININIKSGRGHSAE